MNKYGVIGLGAVAVAGFVGFCVLGASSNDEVRCDRSSVISDINGAYANSPTAKIVQWSAARLDNINTLSSAKDNLHCSATALMNDGEEHKLEYKYTWKTDGKVYVVVQMVN
jgi:hypothetical protein